MFTRPSALCGVAVDPATPNGAPRLSTPENTTWHDSRVGKPLEINGKGEETGNGVMVKTSPAGLLHEAS
jgi:hypothetical protein